MKFQYTKHKKLWNKVLKHMEDRKFPSILSLKMTYCRGLINWDYACEYAFQKYFSSYCSDFRKYCTDDNILSGINWCICCPLKMFPMCNEQFSLYSKIKLAYSRQDYFMCTDLIKKIIAVPVKEGVEYE